MLHLASDSFAIKAEQLAEMAERYAYDPWRVRIFDMQRESVRLINPPQELLPDELRERFRFATLTMQANGFTFTTSEPSCPEPFKGHLVTPYTAEASMLADGICSLQLSYEGMPVDGFVSLWLVEIMGKPSVHYFAFKEQRTGRPLPVYLVLNPYENCAYRCKYCSRLPYFGKNGYDYRANIEATISEVTRQIASPQEVKFVNIITGSTATAGSDLAMCREIIDAFAAAGFGHCDYGFYTSNFQSREQLEVLRAMGVSVLTVTIETTSRESRLRLHEPGNPKCKSSFEDVLDLIRQAEEIFPVVNATLMLGYEPADGLKRNLERLARETHATVNHYIPRLWLNSQHDLLHPSACDLEYYVDLAAFIEQNVNAGRTTIGSVFEERFGIPQFELRYRS